MAVLIRILGILAIAYLVWRLISSSRPPAAAPARFPCSSCAHCAGLFDDGALCRYGERETFMSEVHIANCRSWEKRASGSERAR